MLAEFSLSNFKSYRQARLPLAPLTLLIGANASGKSNALEALRLLSWLAQGHKLSALRYELQDADPVIRGTVADLPYRGERGLGFGCRIGPGRRLSDLRSDFVPALGWERFHVRLELIEDELRILEESIESAESSVPLYEVRQSARPPSHDIRVAYNNFARGGRKPQITCSDQELVFLQLQTAARFESGHAKAQREIPAVTDAYRLLLAGILFLDPSPRSMRQYAFKGDDQLIGDGRNLSGILFGLSENTETMSKLLGFVASLPEQNISDINFISTPRGEVMLQLSETFGGQRHDVDAPLLSDGTLRILAVAAALLSAPQGSMVVIEEIDNGVHPTRASVLMQRIRAVASERHLRVLLTTHNPALMDALPDEALGDVVFCYRDPSEGDSRLVRLADLSRAPSLLAQGSLGELVTRGALDRFVKQGPSRDDQRARARAWLGELTPVAD